MGGMQRGGEKCRVGEKYKRGVEEQKSGEGCEKYRVVKKK